MSRELEPCPFCGGEAKVDWFYYRDEPWKVRVCCRQCAGNIYERARTHYHDCINHYESVEEAEAAAVKEWNTRYKRTCYFNMSNPPTRGWYCSECHVYISDEAMADATTWLKPKFCPNCGAEVADD